MKIKLLLLIGNLSTAFINFLLIFTLAKFGKIGDLGKYTYTFAILSPIYIFANMKLGVVVSTDIKNQFDLNDYFSYRIISLILALIIGVTLISIINTKYLLYAIIIAFFKSSEILSEFNYGLWQKENKFIFIAKSLIIKNILSTVIFILSYFIFKNFILSLILVTIIYLMCYMKESFSFKTKFIISINKVRLKNLLKITYSLGFSGFIAALIINIPRYFLENQFSEVEVGIYSTLSYFLVVFNIYISSLGQILLPKLTKHYAENRFKSFHTDLLKTLFLGLIYGVVIYILAILLSESLIRFFLGIEYAKHSYVLHYLTFSCVFLYATVYLRTAFNAMRKFGIQLLINIITLILVIILSIILIPNGSIKGATLVVSYANILTAILYLIIYYFVAIYMAFNKQKNIE